MIERITRCCCEVKWMSKVNKERKAVEVLAGVGRGAGMLCLKEGLCLA